MSWKKHGSYVNSCWQQCMFPSIQDPGHFPHNRTNTNCHCAPLTVCSERYNSHKTEKTNAKTVTVKKLKKEEWCLPYRPPRDPFWAACIQPALSCLWHESSYSLSPSPSLSRSLSHSLSLSLQPPSLALPFRLKPEGKSLLLNSDAAGLTKPLNGEVGSSQWERRRGGGHNHMRQRKRERKALGNDVGGGKRCSPRETRKRR